MDVVALCDIAPGTELCIHYVDCDVPVSTRRQELLSAYHFLCDCNRCARESLPGAKHKQSYPRSVNHHDSRPRPPRKQIVGRRLAHDAGPTEAGAVPPVAASLEQLSLADDAPLPSAQSPALDT